MPRVSDVCSGEVKIDPDTSFNKFIKILFDFVNYFFRIFFIQNIVDVTLWISVSDFFNFLQSITMGILTNNRLCGPD